MDRFFCVLALCALLLLAAGRMEKPAAQDVFFSLLFPQLIPGCEVPEGTQAPGALRFGEAVLL